MMQTLDHMDIHQLQSAVMGEMPNVKPYEALAALQRRVKDGQMQQAQALQNPAQPPVAQQEIAKAMQLQPAQVMNPYMAQQQPQQPQAGLGQAPVQSPVGMAGGGIVAFGGGGEVPGYADGVYVQSPSGMRYRDADTSTSTPFGTQLSPDDYDLQMAKLHPGDPAFTPEALAMKRRAREIDRYKNFPVQTNAETDRLLRANSAVPPVAQGSTLGAPAAPVKPATGLGAAQAAQPAAKPAAGLAGAAPAAAGYDIAFTPMSMDDRLKEVMASKKALGAQNAEFLRPQQERLTKYESELEADKKKSGAEALIAAGLGMASGTSPHWLQNIAAGAKEGMVSLADSRKLERLGKEKLLAAEGDLAKSKIALEKGDEASAIALQNQARQEAQYGSQAKLLSQHYKNQDLASMTMANARMSMFGAGQDDKHMAALAKVQTALNGNPAYKKAAELSVMPGPFGERARVQMQQMEQEVIGRLAPELLQGRGGNTMGSTTPSPGAGGQLPPLSSFYNK
jgi:hypothetical protein